MNSRSHQFRFEQEREKRRVLLWNGGRPLIIDARYRRVVTFDVDPDIPMSDLLVWAAKNEVRCVGFNGDARPRLRPVQRRENTWAVV